METVLHLSNDYPDTFQPTKTRAIYHLVEGTPGYRHVVYSLNRVNGWRGIAASPFGEDRIQIIFKALPKGLFWIRRLQELADWIQADLSHRGIQPDVIEAHKFTVEGVIAERLAERMGCPFICDIQGDTDSKLLKHKRSARAVYRRIAQRAALVFPFAPWNIPLFAREVGLDAGKCRVLPVIPGVEAMQPAPIVQAPKIITLFHLQSWRRKNIENLAKAVNLLADRYPELTLDVYGGGSAKDKARIHALLAKADAHRRVTLKGPLAHADLPATLQHYAAFALPSKAESYGMVFAEALLNGLPVLYPKGWAIDGLFPVEKIGYAANGHSVEDIARGLEHLLTHQAELKQSIAGMQKNGELSQIGKDAILATYRAGLEAVLGRKAPT